MEMSPKWPVTCPGMWNHHSLSLIIYQTDLRLILRVSRAIAVDVQSEINYSIPLETLPQPGCPGRGTSIYGILVKSLSRSLLSRSCLEALTIILLLLLAEKHIFFINCNVCYFNFILALQPCFYTSLLFLLPLAWFCYFQLYGAE